MQRQILLSQDLCDQVHEYSSFSNPPSFKLAQIHRQATSIGIQPPECEAKLCPCCQNTINKTPLPICFEEDQLLNYGIGYPMCFKLMKAVSLILCVTFLCQQIIRSPFFGSLLTSMLMYAVVVMIKTKMGDEMNYLCEKIECPSSCTIMMVFSATNIEEDEILKKSEFVFNEMPVNLTRVYDSSQLQRAYKDLQQECYFLNALNIKIKKSAQQDKKQFLNKKVELIKKRINDCLMMMRRFRSHSFLKGEKANIIFISFEKTSTVDSILKNLQQNPSRIAYICEKLLPQTQILSISRALSPKQIAWKKIARSKNIPHRSKCIQFILKIIPHLILLFYEGLLSYALIQDTPHHNIYRVPEAILLQNIIIGIIIETINFGTEYFSYTKDQSIYYLYCSVFQFFNCCILMFMCKRKFDQSNEDLLRDIHTILVLNVVSLIAFKIFNPFLWIKQIIRYLSQKTKPQSNPITQQNLNKRWEKIKIMLGHNYLYMTRVVVVTLWYADAAPFGILISILGVLIDYLLCRLFFSKVYLKPNYISQDIVKPFLSLIEFLPFIYLIGSIVYTCNSYGDPDRQLDPVFNMFSCILGIIALILIMVIRRCCFSNTKNSQKEEKNYSNKGSKFFSLYQNTQKEIIQQYLKDINFVQRFILEQGNKNSMPIESLQ